MAEPLKEEIISYYNKVVQGKLNNYLYGNPRIDASWNTIKKYAPDSGRPLDILEVGCGVGAVCNKLHKRWSRGSITGIDISSKSIAIARKLFANDQVSFREGILTPDTFDQSFDLIIFMDVYEHIAVYDRPTVHAAIKKLLKNKGRLILSVPTPHILKWSAVHKPETMQPIDEHITLTVINQLAQDTETEVIYYEKRDIWNTGDYAHVVFEKNDDFEAAFFHPKAVGLFHRSKRRIKHVLAFIKGNLRELNVKRKLS